MLSRAINGSLLMAKPLRMRQNMLVVSFSTSSPVLAVDASSAHQSGGAEDAAESTEKPPSKGSRLMTVLAGMKVEKAGSSSKRVDAQEKTDLSSPFMETSPKIQGKQTVSRQFAPKVDPVLVDATEKLADAFSAKIDPATVKSELLSKLMDHAEQTEKAKVSSGKNLSHLIAGMKIDRSRPKADAGTVVSPDMYGPSIDVARGPITSMMQQMIEHDAGGGAQSRRDFAQERQQRRRQQAPPERVDIFGAPPLGIFKNLEALNAKPQPKMRVWDILEEQTLLALQSLPPKNAFEEMINWTHEKKVWHFPIDNSQGVLDHEQDVDFSEHVFLDHLIADFPKKGPIKQFMDVVIYALSRNAFITVQDKEDYVDWFRQYFKKKQDIVLDVMGPELGSFTERNSEDESVDSEAPSAPPLHDRPPSKDKRNAAS